MAVPVLNERQDYGGKLSPLDRRQFIDFGGKYRGTFTMGLSKLTHKRSASFSRKPAEARAIYNLLADAACSPGYFKWQPVGDTAPRYWTVDADSLKLSEDSYGRAVVSVELTEYAVVGGVV